MLTRLLTRRAHKATRRARGARRQELAGLPSLEGELLGKGFFNDVWSPDGRTVVKVARQFGPLVQPLSWIERNRREHEMVQSYIPVPPTYHVRVRDKLGHPANVLLQEKLDGELLTSVADDRLRDCARYGELEAMVARIEECYQQLGWLPDVIGGPPRWGMHDLRRSNNYLLDTEGRLWLIDPGALFFWFSRRNPIGRLYTGLLLWSGRRLVERLDRH